MKDIYLLTHFYNESYFLYFFCNYYKDLVDSCICINHKSTDNSVDIIKKICPHWKIVDTELEEFSAYLNDVEVIKYEETFPTDSWKIVANITEFILNRNLKEYLNTNHINDKCVSFDSVVMVDNTSQQNLVLDIPLQKQLFYGYIDRTHQTRRRRYLHRYKNGAYHLGRHSTNHLDVFDSNLLLNWFGFSPRNSQNIKRKLQIQDKIPQSDKNLLLGHTHLHTPESLEQEWNRQISLSYDLRSDEIYNQNLVLMEK